MPRARSLKPGFFKNESLADLGPEAMLLFAGLWTLADRAGRLEDRPKRIKAEVFPYWPKTNVDNLLKALSEAGFIVRYQAGEGMHYIAIPTWNRHQSPHVKEVHSTIPAPCLHGAEPSAGQPFPEPAHLTPSSLTPSSLTADIDPQPPAPIGACSLAPAAQPKSKKRNRAEVEKTLGMRIVWWKEFWSIFPCHEGGLPGMDAFERKVRDEETWRAVKAGAIRYRERANADPEMRLKYAQGWLNDERWTDEARPREPPRSASKIDQAMEIFEEKYSGLWPPTEIR